MLMVSCAVIVFEQRYLASVLTNQLRVSAKINHSFLRPQLMVGFKKSWVVVRVIPLKENYVVIQYWEVHQLVIIGLLFELY